MLSDPHNGTHGYMIRSLYFDTPFDDDYFEKQAGIELRRMAHALGIEVLCEGIESESENQKVTNAECDYIQGFLYSHVLPIENALEFYNNKQ